MGSVRILDQADEAAPYLDDVIAATDAHKRELGFLPKAVYASAIDQGTIWIAVSNGSYRGHLFFTGVQPTLKIQQLFVSPGSRKRGVARALVEALVRYGVEAGYGSIRARVAEDLDANAAWARLGFEVGKAVPGGRTTGRTLLVRYRRLMPRGPQTNFFALCDQSRRQLKEIKALGLPVSGSECYTLDVNIWLDFLLARAQFGEMARELIRQASLRGLRLRITEALREEARRTSARRVHDPLLMVALEWPSLEVIEDESVEALVEDLRSLVFPDRSLDRRGAANDMSDLRHLALSIVSNATGFITRDRHLLRARAAVEALYRLRIVSPAELLEVQHEGLGTPRLGLDSQGAGVHLLPLSGVERRDAIAFIDSFVDGERPHQRLDPESEGRVCFIGRDLIGVVHWPAATCQSPHVELLIADSNSAGFEARRQAFDVLVGWLLLEVRPQQGLRRVLLRVDLETLEDFGLELQRMGFFRTARIGDCVRFLLGRPIDLRWSDIQDAVQQELGARSRWLGGPDGGPVLSLTTADGELALEQFDFETRFGLTRDTLEEKAAWYVPVRPEFRDELLPKPPQMAFLRQRDASLRVERVYFCSPVKPLPAAGDILLWYVSKDDMAIVGFARCTAATIVSVAEARSRFARLAVIRPDDAAKRGKVKCIAFDNYTPLPRPVSLAMLRRLGAYPKQGPVKVVRLPDTVELVDLLTIGY